MLLRYQLEPNMTPTWPSLGPPEGQSDLYFTGVFEDFMFRTLIVLSGFVSPHGAQHRPNMGPKRAPKSAFEIGEGSPFFGFDVGKPWKTDLGAIWGRS